MECKEDCNCTGCVKAREDFNTWCDQTEARWQKAKQEGRIAHLCTGLLCPTCGDPRDTSILAGVR